MSTLMDKSGVGSVIRHAMMTQPQPPQLLDQSRQAIQTKHFSLKTEKSYIHYIWDFIVFHDKGHPQEIGVAEVRAYLSLGGGLAGGCLHPNGCIECAVVFVSSVVKLSYPRR